MIRVGIIDDSLLVRKLIRKALSNDPEIEVVGEAINVKEGASMIEEFKPDVVTLDLEMEGQTDGVRLLMYIQAQKLPVKTVVVSSIPQAGTSAELCCENLGATSIVPKPEGSSHSVFGKENKILQAVKDAGKMTL